jgi:hypothetical protein
LEEGRTAFPEEAIKTALKSCTSLSGEGLDFRGAILFKVPELPITPSQQYPNAIKGRSNIADSKLFLSQTGYLSYREICMKFSSLLFLSLLVFALLIMKNSAFHVVFRPVYVARISKFPTNRGLRRMCSVKNQQLRLAIADDDFTVSEADVRPVPSSFKSKFLNIMSERGFIHQCTDFHSLDEKLSTVEPVAAYLGFDATARSLHVGSLLQIMILRNLQKSGHKPVVLVGGGTTKIGDPSGKEESRKLLSESAIDENIQSLSKVFERFLKFGDGPTDAILVNNAEWLDSLNYLKFLRDYGRLFTVNRMLSMESVKQRLSREQPLTFLEFNYILLQSYDFVELHRRHNTLLQLGGSDQWGNIVSGVELGRKLGTGPLYGLTAPLITTADGKKMGKSVNGAVWLNK